MAVSRLSGNTLKKAVVAAGIVVLAGVCIASPLQRDWRKLSDDGLASGGLVGYMSGILRENRTGLGPIEEAKLARVILAESASHEIDPLFVLALIQTESMFYNWSKSFTGALGLMQISPATGEEIAARLNLEWNGKETLLNPYLNVKMGVHYFSLLNERYKDREMSLAAYNIGPGRLDSEMRENRMAGRGYVNKVLNNYRDLKERADYYSYGG